MIEIVEIESKVILRTDPRKVIQAPGFDVNARIFAETSSALRLWNPLPILERELAEREDLNLPPFTHTVELTMPKEEITRLKNALIKSQEDGRLPEHMKILGPIIKAEKSSIVLLSKPSESKSVNLLVHEFMRRRSLAKKTLPSLRIDPYSLSR